MGGEVARGAAAELPGAGPGGRRAGRYAVGGGRAEDTLTGESLTLDLAVGGRSYYLSDAADETGGVALFAEGPGGPALLSDNFFAANEYVCDCEGVAAGADADFVGPNARIIVEEARARARGAGRGRRPGAACR